MYVQLSCLLKFCVIISFPKPKYYICEVNEHGMENRTHIQSLILVA